MVSYPLALVRTRLQAQSVPRSLPAGAAPGAVGASSGAATMYVTRRAHGLTASAAVAAAGPYGGGGGVQSLGRHHAAPAPHGARPHAPLKYTGMMDVIVKTVQHEGVGGLYRGLAANMLKLAPAAGLGWFVYEESKYVLGVDRPPAGAAC